MHDCRTFFAAGKLQLSEHNVQSYAHGPSVLQGTNMLQMTMRLKEDLYTNTEIKEGSKVGCTSEPRILYNHARWSHCGAPCAKPRGLQNVLVASALPWVPSPARSVCIHSFSGRFSQQIYPDFGRSWSNSQDTGSLRDRLLNSVPLR